MRGHLSVRMIFLVAGVLIGVGLTWAPSPWPVRPLPWSEAARLTRQEHAVWADHRRTQTRLCVVLNSVYGTATIWVVVGGARLLVPCFARSTRTERSM